MGSLTNTQSASVIGFPSKLLGGGHRYERNKKLRFERGEG